MRRQFFAVVDNGGGDLLPLVIEAAKQINRPEAPAKAS
jgi:formate dehydrogenase subunit delta